MNQKELTKTFIMILNRLKPFGLHDLYIINSALWRLVIVTTIIDIWLKDVGLENDKNKKM